jgi:CAAX prenyl protease-like protein
MEESLSIRSAATNRTLLLPFLAPYLVYVGLSSLPLGPEWVYALRLVLVPAFLVWGWRWYPALTGPKSPLASIGVGAAAGIAGAVLWAVLRAPFAGEAAAPWAGAAFGLRLAAAGLVVPVFEELLMRGYFLRVALQWDRARLAGARNALAVTLDDRSLLEVEPGAWSPWAVAVSTAAFTLGHHLPEWPAAIAYGLFMVTLWIAQRDLLSCIVAHGVTNVALGLYAQATGQWGLW